MPALDIIDMRAEPYFLTQGWSNSPSSGEAGFVEVVPRFSITRLTIIKQHVVVNNTGLPCMKAQGQQSITSGELHHTQQVKATNKLISVFVAKEQPYRRAFLLPATPPFVLRRSLLLYFFLLFIFSSYYYYYYSNIYIVSYESSPSSPTFLLFSL